MKDKPKLGRGLDDVSQHFLTRKAGEIPHDVSPALRPVVRSVAVCHPGDALRQSGIVANLALELAKQRYPVKIQDYSDPAQVRPLMGTVLREEDCGPDHATVRLYGLPEIEIAESGDPRQARTLPTRETPWEGLRGRYLLANTPGNLDFFLERPAFPEHILITCPGEHALLQAYAYIKVIHAAGAARIHLVLAQAAAKDEAVFRPFADFAFQRLGCPINLLGVLARDEAFDLSLQERRPLVLSRGPSHAAAAFGEICQRLLDTAEAFEPRAAEGI